MSALKKQWGCWSGERSLAVLPWWAAAEIIGVTDRTMRRWREWLEAEGYSGLVEEVLRLYQETCFDLNIRHFDEKLGEEYGIQPRYMWVLKAKARRAVEKALSHRSGDEFPFTKKTRKPLRQAEDGSQA